MMVSGHGKSFWHDLRPHFCARNCENAIFELNFVYFWPIYKSYLTLRVYTGVSKGAEFIHDGLRSYIFYLTWFEAWFWCRKGMPPPTAVNMGPLRNLRKCNFLARFSVSVVQVQHLCYPESLCRGFKGSWILLWWSQFIWNLIRHDLKPDYVKEVENVCICGPIVIAFLPREFLQRFQGVLNLLMVVSYDIKYMWNGLRPDLVFSPGSCIQIRTFFIVSSCEKKLQTW